MYNLVGEYTCSLPAANVQSTVFAYTVFMGVLKACFYKGGLNQAGNRFLAK